MKKDYSDIERNLANNKILTNYLVEDGIKQCGYHIHINNPLTEIYGFTVFMVDFVLINFDNLHSNEQAVLVSKMLNKLYEEVYSNKGYYNFRIPSEYVDLNERFNMIFKNFFFCGGLNIYVSPGILPKKAHSDSIKILKGDENYFKNKGDAFLEIAKESFSAYQGQYHISPVMKDKAGDIYVEWLERGFNNSNEKVFVAEYNGEPAGFWTYNFDELCQTTGLVAVTDRFRNKGIYFELVYSAVNEANSNKVFMTIGTQFNNLIVQRVWNKMGFLHFVNYYNIHLDNRG
ncbi:MAG: GNAT family N-acetyltransferase [Peptostreptococcaceae bacterium]|nr:GNAT family N-acetyltransferase [Peptostreptococcaceae bacterium]